MPLAHIIWRHADTAAETVARRIAGAAKTFGLFASIDRSRQSASRYVTVSPTAFDADELDEAALVTIRVSDHEDRGNGYGHHFETSAYSDGWDAIKWVARRFAVPAAAVEAHRQAAVAASDAASRAARTRATHATDREDALATEIAARMLAGEKLQMRFPQKFNRRDTARQFALRAGLSKAAATRVADAAWAQIKKGS